MRLSSGLSTPFCRVLNYTLSYVRARDRLHCAAAISPVARAILHNWALWSSVLTRVVIIVLTWRTLDLHPRAKVCIGFFYIRHRQYRFIAKIERNLADLAIAAAGLLQGLTHLQ